MCKIAKVLLVGKEGILIARLGIDILPGVQSDFILHPLIHSFGSRKDTTIYMGGSERARVCIKVSYVQSPGIRLLGDEG